MDRSTLEKLILAKLPSPADFCHAIKCFFPLNPPTPTAQLMKAVCVTYNQRRGNVIEGRCYSTTFVNGTGLRVYELSGRWSAPPLRPEIQYSHRYRNVNYWRARLWDNGTGELIGARGIRRVRVTWPTLESESLPTWEHYDRESVDEMARQVRSWTPVSI